jgi:DNA-binding transcriptional LysR family regulator
MRSFVRVAERENLSAVAREFGVGQSTITRHIRELEEALGVSLLSRSTRRVSLTEEGRRYHDNVVEILRLVDEANEDVRREVESSAGIIKVSCSAFFGVMHFCRLIFAFQDQYPDIRVDLVLTDERLDLIRDGVDLALQIGALPDSEMKVRTLGEVTPVLVVASSYLERRGRPVTPADLANHEVIRKTDILKSNQLTLIDASGESYQASFQGRFRVDHGLAAREALMAGRGISPVPRWLVDDLLDSGQLEIVLPEFHLPATPLNLLYLPDRASVTRVRLLKDYLSMNITAIPGVQRQ